MHEVLPAWRLDRDSRPESAAPSDSSFHGDSVLMLQNASVTSEEDSQAPTETNLFQFLTQSSEIASSGQTMWAVDAMLPRSPVPRGSVHTPKPGGEVLGRPRPDLRYGWPFPRDDAAHTFRRSDRSTKAVQTSGWHTPGQETSCRSFNEFIGRTSRPNQQARPRRLIENLPAPRTRFAQSDVIQSIQSPLRQK